MMVRTLLGGAKPSPGFILAGVILLCALRPGPTSAHDGVLFGVRPFSEAGEFAGGGTSYGLVLAEGERNLWTCQEAIEATPFWWHRLSAERVLVGTDQGIRISQDGGCSWTVPEGPAGSLPNFSISPRPDLPEHLVSTTGDGTEANHVLQSLDGGLTWTSLFSVEGAAIWRAIWDRAGTGLVAEAVLPFGPAQLYRSTDAGGTWSESPLDLGAFRSVGFFGPSLDGQKLWLTALSPQGEFVLGQVPSDLSSGIEVIRAFPQLITGFAEEEGLLHLVLGFSDYQTWTGLPEDDPTSLDAGIGTCLYELDGVLWGCGGEPMHAQFSRRVSSGSWQDVIRLADIEPRSCGPETKGAALCPAVWDAIQEELSGARSGGDESPSDCEGCGEPAALTAVLLMMLPLGWGRRRPAA
jgi:hypothetical protein